MSIDELITALNTLKEQHGNIPVYFTKGHGVEPVGNAIVGRGHKFVTLYTAMKS